jgi:pyrroline-5-carboxylate reductase
MQPTTTIGFIGGGRITSIFVAAWARAGAAPANIIVSDANAGVLEKLKTAYAVITTAGADNAQPASQDVVFLAVHPPVLKEVLPAIRSALQPGAIVVSLAPKFTVARLAEMLGGFARIVRVIPNAPSIVGAGFNPVVFSPSLSAADRAQVLGLLGPLGEAPEVAEEKLEAYAILTAMGPTYFWYQWFELTRVAESFGLSHTEAREGLAKMLSGAVRTMAETKLSSDQILDLIPVKPLADIEPSILDAYRTKLPALFEKIKP